MVLPNLKHGFAQLELLFVEFETWFAELEPLVRPWYILGSSLARPWFVLGSSYVRPWFSLGVSLVSSLVRSFCRNSKSHYKQHTEAS